MRTAGGGKAGRRERRGVGGDRDREIAAEREGQGGRWIFSDDV